MAQQQNQPKTKCECLGDKKVKALEKKIASLTEEVAILRSEIAIIKKVLTNR